MSPCFRYSMAMQDGVRHIDYRGFEGDGQLFFIDE